MKEALFYSKIKDKKVQCKLCPHFCSLKENEFGKCKVRKNISGILYSLSYEKPVATNIDPIEKKPFYHFLPGSKSFSIGMAGCNLKCLFCQNWEMSQKSPEETLSLNVKSEEVIKGALKSNCHSISFTYNEPCTSYEYMLDIAKLAKKAKIKCVIVSNGFINPEPLKKLSTYIKAANIDLKGNSLFYEQICEGKIDPVLETLKFLKQKGVWLEITNLIVPGYNDNVDEFKKTVLWIKENLGVDTPLHLSAFHPCYKLNNIPATDPALLIKLRIIAKSVGLRYVYTGNINDLDGSTTFCPKCGQAVLVRKNFTPVENKLKRGKCCKEKLPGVWQ
jgi:pyruvate formate lyase activating enzyme